jgi:hypothetical protein
MLVVAEAVKETMEHLLEGQLLGSFVGLAVPVEAEKVRVTLQTTA